MTKKLQERKNLLASQEFNEQTYSDLWEPYRVAFEMGFDACYAELMPEIQKLVKALDSCNNCFSCIRHNCRPDAFLLALDVSSQITMRHIDISEELSRDTLNQFKQFMGEEQATKILEGEE